MLLPLRRLLILGAVLSAAGAKYDRCTCTSCGGSERPRVWNWEVTEDPPDVPPGAGSSARRPYPPKGNLHVLPNTSVHLLLSSFRDPRCGQSVYNAFARAKHPDRIWIGVVQQNLGQEEDPFDCVSVYCALMKLDGVSNCPRLDRISILRGDARLSKGPIWARALGVTMIRPEHEFCMQVDAHVDFRQDYDEILMRMWAMTENEYGVLSTYVGRLKQDLSASGEVLIGHPRYEIPIICDTIVGGYGAVRNSQARGAICLSRPALSLSWAAGWSFARCHFERNIANDPYLEGMFDGEEFSRQVRLFTHGYDTYTPHRPVVFHDYTHHRPWQQGRESTWWKNPANATKAITRYNALMEKGPMVPLGPYGLGRQRTLDQYIEFAGINTRNSTYLGRQLCGRLRFVPFEEDPAKITAKAPEYPQPLPGELVLDSSLAPLPQVSVEYVEYARTMRTELSQESPELSAAQQALELGTSVRYWDNLIAALRASPGPAPAAAQGGGGGAASATPGPAPAAAKGGGGASSATPAALSAVEAEQLRRAVPAVAELRGVLRRIDRDNAHLRARLEAAAAPTPIPQRAVPEAGVIAVAATVALVLLALRIGRCWSGAGVQRDRKAEQSAPRSAPAAEPVGAVGAGAVGLAPRRADAAATIRRL